MSVETRRTCDICRNEIPALVDYTHVSRHIDGGCLCGATKSPP